MQETAEQYKRKIYAFLAERDPVKLQAAAPATLAKLLKRVSPAKARKRPAPDKWSISEIVAHLADTEFAMGWRVRMVLGQPGEPIQPFDQDAWAAAMRYEKRDARKSFEQYRSLREANVALFKSLTPEDWKKSAIHPERGEQTVRVIVEMTAGHDLNHFSQIERILAAK
ncbi:MAG: DinB family protein [Acidobacteriota bacterium]|nr:DinB family protein [Acidobacteriota bacterium]MDE3169012.1 DinB family protein [Acidobacteriota bacterium]